MTMEQNIKKISKETKIAWKKIFTKVILGEFNRINDGKLVDDTQGMSVINTLVKNSKELLKINKNDELAKRELEFLQTFLPTKATKNDMIFVIIKILNENTFKNSMQAMKPCIELLEKQGLYVDKSELSKLLKEF